jgi:steroid 5-alpha reductase family enzyme
MDKKRLIIYPLLFIATLALATQGFTKLDTTGLLVPLLVTYTYFIAIFIFATIIKNNSIVDIGWGLGFVIGAWTSLVIAEDPTLLSYLIVGFITVWGLRLSVRLLYRNYGKPEDFRYAQWRKEWGDQVVLIAFFRVFTIQAIINFIVGSVSYVMILNNTYTFEEGIPWIVYLGLGISLTGLFFEVVGDEQLRRHIKKKTHTLLQTGLWSITRHPNYLGEILIWVGLYIAGISLVLDDSVNIFYYLFLILSPLVMSTVLIKISTPLLEKNMARYDGWEAYTQKVPMLFPWARPKK